MKTLPEILRDAMLLLARDPDDRESVVVIARGQCLKSLDGQALRLLRSEAFQIRLWHDQDDTAENYMGHYRCEARSWLGAQWSSWREHRGLSRSASFDIDDVLATDWRISS